MNQVPEKDILVRNQIKMYSKTISGQYNVTTRIEQVQNKTKTLTGQRRNTIKTSYVSILRLSSFYLYKLQTIGLLHLYYIVSSIQMFVYLYIQHSLTGRNE